MNSDPQLSLDTVLNDSEGTNMAKKSAKTSMSKKTSMSNMGMIGGAAAGAAAGALVGPLGAAVGAVVGGFAGANANEIAANMPHTVKDAPESVQKVAGRTQQTSVSAIKKATGTQAASKKATTKRAAKK